MMRCSACGARCDPDRSFCQRCGSAVFLDEASFLGSRILTSPVASAPVQTPTAPRVTRVARQAARRTIQTAGVGSAGVGSVGAGCAGSLVRWAVFLGIAYYVLGTIGRLPEVRDTWRALERGEQVDLTPAANAIRALVHLPPISRTDSTPESPAPRTPERQAERPSTGSPEPTVYEPQQVGIIPPTVVTRVPARYPPEAVREGLQGTVILRCIVEPDGSVSSATVTKSIDTRFGLDEEAVKAVKQWRFEPGRREGVPVRVATLVTVTFSLRAPASAPTPAR